MTDLHSMTLEPVPTEAKSDPLIEELAVSEARQEPIFGGLITTSAQCGALYAAFARAQLGYDSATKDAMNPHFGKTYADLATGIRAVRAALNREGIAFLQATDAGASNQVTVETRLTHSSGQWMASVMRIPTAQFTPQGVGSATTYARRYAGFAMFGIAPEDDDGEAAQGRHEPQRQEAPRAAARAAPHPAGLIAQTAKSQPPPPHYEPEDHDDGTREVTAEQRSEISQHARRLSWPSARIAQEIEKITGRKDGKLSTADANRLLGTMRVAK